MCIEARVADVWAAALDRFEDDEDWRRTAGGEPDFEEPDFDEPDFDGLDLEGVTPHEAEHARRARQLDEMDEPDAASIHRALRTNIARAGGRRAKQVRSAVGHDRR